MICGATESFIYVLFLTLGTYGAAVSFVCVGQELDGLRAIANRCGTKILQLPGE